MPARQLSRRMSAEDASFLYFETANAPLHIGSVGIFEGVVDFQKFYDSLNARMHLIPRYRQQALIPPFYAGHPTWEDDPQFSLDRHLSLRQIAAPGTREQLQQLCAEIFQPTLQARPPAVGHHRHPRHRRRRELGDGQPRAPLHGRWRLRHRAAAGGHGSRAEPRADAAAGRAVAPGRAARTAAGVVRRAVRPVGPRTSARSTRRQPACSTRARSSAR